MNAQPIRVFLKTLLRHFAAIDKAFDRDAADGPFQDPIHDAAGECVGARCGMHTNAATRTAEDEARPLLGPAKIAGAPIYHEQLAAIWRAFLDFCERARAGAGIGDSLFSAENGELSTRLFNLLDELPDDKPATAAEPASEVAGTASTGKAKAAEPTPHKAPPPVEESSDGAPCGVTFTGDPIKNPDVVDLARKLVDKPPGEWSSVAREFSGNKGNSLLAQIRRLRTEGRILFTY